MDNTHLAGEETSKFHYDLWRSVDKTRNGGRTSRSLLWTQPRRLLMACRGHCIQTVTYSRSVLGLVMLDAGGLELPDQLADLGALSAGRGCRSVPCRHGCPLLTVDGPIGAHGTVHTRQAGELMTAQSVTGRRARRVPDDQVIDGELGESFPR